MKLARLTTYSDPDEYLAIYVYAPGISFEATILRAPIDEIVSDMEVTMDTIGVKDDIETRAGFIMADTYRVISIAHSRLAPEDYIVGQISYNYIYSFLQITEDEGALDTAFGLIGYFYDDKLQFFLAQTEEQYAAHIKLMAARLLEAESTAPSEDDDDEPGYAGVVGDPLKPITYH